MTFGQDRQDRREVRAFGKETFPHIGVCHLLALTTLKLSCQRPPEQAPRDDGQVHGEHATPPPTNLCSDLQTLVTRLDSDRHQYYKHWPLAWGILGLLILQCLTCSSLRTAYGIY